MSLKFRLAVLNTFFVLVALGIGIGILVVQTQNVFMGSIDRELFSRADRIMNNPNLRNRDKPFEVGEISGPLPGQMRQGGGIGSVPNSGNIGFGQGQSDEGPNGPQNPNQPDPNNPQAGQENSDPTQRAGQPAQQPNGPGFRMMNSIGPEFAGPPNNDIARPIALTISGQNVDSRIKRILDAKAIENKEMMRPVIVTILVEGIPTRVITTPMRGRGKLLGFAQFGHDLQDFDRLKDTQTTTIVFLLPIVLLISAGLGWFLAGMAVKPIERFAAASAKISESDMSTRLEAKGNDEIARLGQSFNAMVDRLQLSFTERQKLFEELQATLEQQKQFVGDASHELRTPLARLRITTSSALEQESTPEEMKEALEIADRETVHMSNLVDQLLVLARLDSAQPPALEPVDLHEVAQEAADKFPVGQLNSVKVEGASAHILGHHDGLLRAVSNLIENAGRYCPDKPIVVSTQVVDGKAILVVRDQGVGIEAQHIPHLTERFYRVDDARNRKMGGTGLGLAIVKSIVESNDGTMTIQSRVGEGTAVRLSFPINPVV